MREDRANVMASVYLLAMLTCGASKFFNPLSFARETVTRNWRYWLAPSIATRKARNLMPLTRDVAQLQSSIFLQLGPEFRPGL
jgi:hypothetical protein